MEGQIILFMISKDKQYGTELGYSFLHHKPLCSNRLDVLVLLQTAFFKSSNYGQYVQHISYFIGNLCM